MKFSVRTLSWPLATCVLLTWPSWAQEADRESNVDNSKLVVLPEKLGPWPKTKIDLPPDAPGEVVSLLADAARIQETFAIRQTGRVFYLSPKLQVVPRKSRNFQIDATQVDTTLLSDDDVLSLALTDPDRIRLSNFGLANRPGPDFDCRISLSAEPDHSSGGILVRVFSEYRRQVSIHICAQPEEWLLLGGEWHLMKRRESGGFVIL